ncbi:monoacylglycerol lipase ABHD12 isoform X2 [Agrilus planipennis]|uniref:Monoacylglycerol lipase ABHD12 isoform X2 n=2 Tax=Agrilus planipennis TaxID=224129 RepID=A0A1W4WJU8_AGRPL|nr:monoacylglycerol lipase ABHD12 isoform X2 [Agrilus planipennis]
MGTNRKSYLSVQRCRAMISLRRKRIIRRILFGTFKLLLLAFFIVFVIGPLVFKYSYSLQRSVIFLNYVNFPVNPNYSNPAAYGLPGVLNFDVITDDNIKLGVWYILPEEIIKSSHNDVDINTLATAKQVVLYNHGNSGNRVSPHRVELYQVLRKYFHVVAFDYRSYGDSSDVEPSEEGLVSDAKFMFKWIRNHTSSDIFVWGHSLGTAISTRLVRELEMEKIQATGLILESPFNNMREEIARHPLATAFKNLPWFQFTVVNPMQENGFKFENDKNIQNVNCSILILHAKDDFVVPYQLGYELYKTALSNRQNGQGSVQLESFDSKFSYGHKHICRAPELPRIIENFIVKARDEFGTRNQKDFSMNV